MKKKGIAMQNLMTLVMIVVSGIIIMAVISRLYASVDTGLQDSICSFQVAGANAVINKEVGEGRGIGGYAWGSVSEGAARKSLDKPLCVTKVHTIDLTGARSENEELAQLTIELGEMIEQCWSTFGEGRIANTFGQNDIDGLIDGSIFVLTAFTKGYDYSTHYFNCYTFQIKGLEYSEDIPSDNLSGSTGTLWRFGLKRQALFDENGNYLEDNRFTNPIDVVKAPVSDLDVQESNDAYVRSGRSTDLSYMGNIYWNNRGFFEMAKSLESNDITVERLFGKNFLYPVQSDGNKLDKLEPNVWYDLRYYSPYIHDDVEDITFDLVLNNIRIMPAGAPGGTEVTPVAIS